MGNAEKDGLISYLNTTHPSLPGRLRLLSLSSLTGITGEVDVGPVQAAGDAEALLQGIWVTEPVVRHRCSGKKGGFKGSVGKTLIRSGRVDKECGGSLQGAGRSVSGG